MEVLSAIGFVYASRIPNSRPFAIWRNAATDNQLNILWVASSFLVITSNLIVR
uniref:Uncharacterized protein n=1 Tax=Ascaris lumbricoides TaxID=6252 RepID=A0A0M3IGG6_ASCLU